MADIATQIEAPPVKPDIAAIVVPSHPLSRRIRGWLIWLVLFALLAWAWKLGIPLALVNILWVGVTLLVVQR